MLKKRISHIAAAAMLAFGIGLTGFNANAADFTLKYGHPGPVGPDSDDHVAGEFLKFFLEARSNGRIEVQIFPGSQLGSFREMVEQVNANTLELASSKDGQQGIWQPNERRRRQNDQPSWYPFLRKLLLRVHTSLRMYR